LIQPATQHSANDEYYQNTATAQPQHQM